MPDITMCTGGDCPQRHQCHRHTATPSGYRQAYFTKPPWSVRAGLDAPTMECDHFWDNSEYTNERESDENR